METEYTKPMLPKTRIELSIKKRFCGESFRISPPCIYHGELKPKAKYVMSLADVSVTTVLVKPRTFIYQWNPYLILYKMLITVKISMLGQYDHSYAVSSLPLLCILLVQNAKLPIYCILQSPFINTFSKSP